MGDEAETRVVKTYPLFAGGFLRSLRAMYLRFARRRKDGKEHRYWSIVESRRCAGGRVVQRPVLYLGEINDSQHAAWCRVIEALDADNQRYRQLALFPADRRRPDAAKGKGCER